MIAQRRKFARIHRWIECFWRISDSPMERINYEIPAKIGRIVSLLAFAACAADYLAIVGLALINNHHHHHLLPVNVS